MKCSISSPKTYFTGPVYWNAFINIKEQLGSSNYMVWLQKNDFSNFMVNTYFYLVFINQLCVHFLLQVLTTQTRKSAPTLILKWYSQFSRKHY